MNKNIFKIFVEYRYKFTASKKQKKIVEQTINNEVP